LPTALLANTNFSSRYEAELLVGTIGVFVAAFLHLLVRCRIGHARVTLIHASPEHTFLNWAL
jgi:hypothetical protein